MENNEIDYRSEVMRVEKLLEEKIEQNETLTASLNGTRYKLQTTEIKLKYLEDLYSDLLDKVI